MNKLFKGLFVTVLAAGLLAGCGGEPVVTHTVTFYEDTVGKFYAEVEVEHGTAVEMPADPVVEGKEFIDWFTTTDLTTTFDRETLIVEDIDLYAKFRKEYEPDTRTFYVIGDLKNTAYPGAALWDPLAVPEEGLVFELVEEGANLFEVVVEIGYMGKFKIKQPDVAWNAEEEYNWTNIPADQIDAEIIKEADFSNIQMITAGNYQIRIETDLQELYITRLGDAVGEGVTQDPDPDAIKNWGIVGAVNGWGATPDIALNYKEDGAYYYYDALYLEAGDPAGSNGLKLRTDNTWGEELASHEDNVLPANGGITNTVEEEVVTEGGNLNVMIDGFYSFYLIETEGVWMLTIENMEIVLRGAVFGDSWGADHDALPLISRVADAEVATTYDLVFSGTVTGLLAGEFKVKLGEYGGVSGWDVAFGNAEGGNLVIETAGDYVVELAVELDTLTGEFANGVVTVTAVPGE